MQSSAVTTFGLMRHAETRWNQESKIQGQADTPLAPEGIQQARHWARLLRLHPWDRIISSDLSRAAQTAGLINEALQVPLGTTARLREQDWGNWTGQTPRQIKAQAPGFYVAQVKSGWRFCPPGGEDRNSVWQRGRRALEKAALRRPGASILVVTHEGLIKCLIYRLLSRRFLPTEPSILRPHHLHRLSFGPDGLQIEKINALPLG